MPYIKASDLAEKEITNCCGITELSEKLGISDMTLRKYLSENIIKPEKITIGKRDFYYCAENYIQYLKEKIERYRSKNYKRKYKKIYKEKK